MNAPPPSGFDTFRAYAIHLFEEGRRRDENASVLIAYVLAARQARTLPPRLLLSRHLAVVARRFERIDAAIAHRDARLRRGGNGSEASA